MRLERFLNLSDSIIEGYMKNFSLLVLGLSLLPSLSFSAEAVSCNKKFPATLKADTSFHDGESYGSFELCQNGTCAHIGKSAEVSVKWLKYQVLDQDAKATLAPIADVGLAWATTFVQLIPGLGEAEDAAFMATASGLSSLNAPILAIGVPAVGFIPDMSPRQHWKRSRAMKAVVEKNQLTLSCEQANEFAIALSSYDTRSIGRKMVDSLHEERDEVDNGLQKVWSGGYEALKLLKETEQSDYQTGSPVSAGPAL
jgi:hypothetical protein